MKILILWAILIYINKPIYKYLYKINFKTAEEYDNNVKRVFTPNILQKKSDNDERDYNGEYRAVIFLFLCGAILYLETSLIVGIYSRFVVR
jgi:hypothetical protein